MNVSALATRLLLGLALVLSSAGAALIPVPALASGDVKLDPDEGAIGTRVDVDGSDFEIYAGDKLRIYFSDTDDDAEDLRDLRNYERVATVQVDEEGDFSTYFRIPKEIGDEDVEEGDYYVHVIDPEWDYVLASEDFEVVAFKLELDPSQGPRDKRVEVEGTGFDFYEDDEIEIYFSDEDEDELDDLSHWVRVRRGVDIKGDDFSTHFYIPWEMNGEDVENGIYYVHAVDREWDEILATAKFEVTITRLEIYPGHGAVGAELNITGAKFAAGKRATFYYDDSRIGTRKSNGEGDLSFVFTIPPSYTGKHVLRVVDTEDNEAEATLEVVPAVSLDTTRVTQGSPLNIMGAGFIDRVEVTISLDGEEVAQAETDLHGSFEATIKVPESEGGLHTVAARDDEGNKADTTFTVASVMTISSDEVSSGGRVTVSGNGFAAAQSLTITYDGNEVANVTSKSNGSFETVITVPKSQSGEHTIVVSDTAGNREEAEIRIEAVAPPSPQPLSPPPAQRLGLFGGQQASLDWSDVSDPSGVSYSLQLSTSSDFTGVAVVKTGLSDSQYKLNTAEALETGSYYWRVKAIDGAGNDSGWSSPSQFRVGAFPAWLSPGVLIALIVVILAIIGGVIFATLRRQTV